MGLDTSSAFPRLILLIAISVIKAEERLSWFTKDEELRRSIFVPDNLSEGKEETRTLPWVFHDDQQPKTMQLKCLMRGYNASNNPSDYMDARWSYPGFDESQVNTDIPAEMGDDVGVPFKIWTIEIKTTAADAGRKIATCEFQQGDFPLSTDFIFLIFKRVQKEENGNGQALLSFGLGENLDEKDLTRDIEEDIKRQISGHYKKSLSDVTRCQDGQTYCISVLDPDSNPDPGPRGIQIFCAVLISLIVLVVMVYGGVMAHRDEKINIEFGFVQCGLCCARLLVRCGCKDLVRMFLERTKDDIERTDKRGRTSLINAANGGHSEMVSLLIEYEANIDIKDSKGRTPIINAARKGHSQTVIILIEKGASLESRDSNGCSPLMLAAHGGHNEVIKVLCENGADVNGKANNHYTAVMWAASAGHAETVKVLCEYKADLKSKDEKNNTAAMIAASAGHQDTEKLITEYATDPDAGVVETTISNCVQRNLCRSL